ncbi:MAG TPA: hypothetical protein GXX72_05800 [Clostridiaceae bacterium]|nr:hypothetical protein [Clostridiaceae bacterium]
MDYLEGFLIGPVWTDTDYETRRHTAVHFFVAALVGIYYIFLQIFPDRQKLIDSIPWPYSLVIFISLMLITPLIACFYYRIPIYVRPLILCLYVFKFLMGFWLLLQLTLPLYVLKTEGLQEYIFEEVNKNIETAINWFNFLGYLFSMVLGIIAGGLWLVLRFVLIMLIVIAIPLAVFIIIKLLQYGLDSVVARFFSKNKQVY